MIFVIKYKELPSDKRLDDYGKSPFLMGKSTSSMAIFNGYVNVFMMYHERSSDQSQELQ